MLLHAIFVVLLSFSVTLLLVRRVSGRFHTTLMFILGALTSSVLSSVVVLIVYPSFGVIVLGDGNGYQSRFIGSAAWLSVLGAAIAASHGWRRTPKGKTIGMQPTGSMHVLRPNELSQSAITGITNTNQVERIWHYWDGEKSVGPYKTTEIAALLKSQVISGSQYLRREENDDWSILIEIDELASLVTPSLFQRSEASPQTRKDSGAGQTLPQSFTSQGSFSESVAQPFQVSSKLRTTGLVLAALLLGVSISYFFFNPQKAPTNFNECVLAEMRGQSKEMRIFAVRACRERFPDGQS